MTKVIVVAPGGAARLMDEADRLADIKARAQVPEDVGPVPVAPARGAFRVVETTAMYPKGAGDFESRPAGHQGRRTVRLADVFDLMLAQARRAKRPAPLSPSQIAMARHYRDLHERHANAGVRCSSLEAMSGGSGDADAWIEAVLRDREELARLRRRIGDGSAKGLRVIRPSARGSRRAILDRALVDMVCLEDKPLGAVLLAHGWSAKGEIRAALRSALAGALDRMTG